MARFSRFNPVEQWRNRVSLSPPVNDMSNTPRQLSDAFNWSKFSRRDRNYLCGGYKFCLDDAAVANKKTLKCSTCHRNMEYFAPSEILSCKDSSVFDLLFEIFA
jgi:hypothetical protein